jgi:LemA protein
MNKSILYWAIPLGLLVLLGLNAVSSYNGFVASEEGVDAAWADVETQYQRRYDLIPNLVETVKGYADFEQGTLVAVTEARAAALGAMKNAGPDGDTAEFERQNTVVSGALRGLLGYAEQYPDLKANANFRDLQAQLEGTENRITVARTRYNEVVQVHNGKIRRFPARVWAGLFGFESKSYFESTEAAATAPQVSFE